ncbi:hypothetical protein [Nostoc sp.]|uniref:hypothetical protein n=1 Tax=Nostoc sp. TaxID=1180 RepID=UPI002FF61471
MTIRHNFVKLATGIFSVASLLSVLSCPQVKAEEVSLDCNNATLKGIYGFQESGFQGTKAPFTPFSVTRTSVFDGKGNFQGQGYGSVGGNIQQFTTKGAYKVTKDCSVTISNSVSLNGTQAQSNQFGVIVKRGSQILVVQTDSGTNQTGVYVIAK